MHKNQNTCSKRLINLCASYFYSATVITLDISALSEKIQNYKQSVKTPNFPLKEKRVKANLINPSS